jgi:hypothetical protein
MAPKFKDGDVVFAFSGKWVSWAHTAIAYSEATQHCFLGYFGIANSDQQLLS